MNVYFADPASLIMKRMTEVHLVLLKLLTSLLPRESRGTDHLYFAEPSVISESINIIIIT